MTQQAPGRIPMAVKLGYTAFMAILVPVYWYHYGPTNFLYFCDVALFLTLAGVWTEKPLLISLPAVGILASQALWLLDFVFELAGGQLTGMTAYMFDPQRPLYLRGLSLFHGWLPILLVYLVMRSGYDRRALWMWTATAWALVWISFLFLPGPSANHGIGPVNVNYVWGFSDTEPQAWMPPLAWVFTEMAALFLVLYLPVHLLLRRFAPAAPG